MYIYLTGKSKGSSRHAKRSTKWYIICLCPVILRNLNLVLHVVGMVVNLYSKLTICSKKIFYCSKTVKNDFTSKSNFMRHMPFCFYFGCSTNLLHWQVTSVGAHQP